MEVDWGRVLGAFFGFLLSIPAVFISLTIRFSFFLDKRNNFDSPVSVVVERNLVTFSRPFDSIRERYGGVPSVVKCCRWRQILPLSEASDEGDTVVHTGKLFHSHEKL